MMRHSFFPGFTILLALAMMSFQTPQADPDMNYDQQWKQIDSLESEGLFRSALEQTRQLLRQTRADNNAPQQAKCIIYEAKYISRLEENGAKAAIGRLQEAVAGAEDPLRSLLQSLLAEMYANYTESRYRELADRTAVSDERPEDLAYWTLDQLVGESSRLYLASLSGDQLRRTPIEKYEVLTTNSQFAEGLRPTLYDFLAHRAIEHFSNERNYLTAPAYRFYLDQAEAFAPAAKFVAAAFETRDTSAYQYLAVGIFQDIIAFHLEDEDPSALIDADLRRLEYMYEHSVHDLKDSLYLSALQQLETRYRRFPASSEILYYLAQYHYQKGQSYEPNPEDWLRWEFKKAKALCDAAIRQYPNTYGAKQCRDLVAQITGKTLNLRLEAVNLPGQSLLARLECRNVERAHLRIVRLAAEERETFNRRRPEEVVRTLEKRKPYREWSVKLPPTADFQLHSTEIRIDELPFGVYALMIADQPEFDPNDSQTGYLFTDVSEIGYFYRRSSEGDERFLVVDRRSGQPSEGVFTEFFTVEYRGRDERRQRKIGQGYTDEMGMIAPPDVDRNAYQVRFSKKRDTLYLGEGYYSYSRSYRREASQETHFFLDRAIYRPGQTIYFKALLLAKSADGMPRALPDQEAEVVFYDANNQEVERRKFRSNRYGTFNGRFTAPVTGLRGAMRLTCDVGNSSQSFRVEEYKRPKFEVVLDSLAGTPALGETVTLTGAARAFAGSAVDNAQVRYRVVREVRFPWLPWWSRGGFFPFRSESMEIANGTMRTDAGGAFAIDFVARPDRSIPKDKKPEFSYTVYIDVTDISGEVQSSQKSITLGYIGMKVDLDLSGQVDRRRPLQLQLRTTNLDGAHTPAKGSLRIHRQQGPGQVFVDRYWQKPDLTVIREREFRRYFPLFAFRNEDEPEQWPLVEKLVDRNFDTGQSSEMTLETGKWPVGYYLLELKTQDADGELIQIKRYFSVYDSESGDLPEGELAWEQVDRETAKPGDELQHFLGSADGPLYVLYEYENRSGLSPATWIEVGAWSRQSYQVTEADRGNFLLRTTSVRYNRVFSQQRTVTVPWSQKELQISYETFRDKVRPGAEEEWRLRISGPEKEAVAAEMVAALYDASLDQFVRNQWSFAPYPTLRGSRNNWSARHFGESYLRRASTGFRAPAESSTRVYRSLNWYGFFGAPLAFRGGAMNRRLEMAAPMMEMDNTTVAADGRDTTKEAAPASSEPAPPPPSEGTSAGPAPPALRTNLKETVFFMPELMTDAKGDVILKFTMNEALTRWRLLGFAHTTDLKYGLTENELVTQKELMVLPNAPRFFREGDQIEFTAKVSNMTERPLDGEATLQLYDALTGQPVDELFGHTRTRIAFSTKAGQSDRLAWRLNVPAKGFSAVSYAVTVRAENFSDGEKDAVPVISNRLLVTETKPLPIRGGKRETYEFEALAKLNQSPTLESHAFTLEFTPNPAWYAVKSLPYLMEYPHQCIEQIFNRYYANSLAASVANDNPKVKAVFESWKGTDALESPLVLNPELKAVLLEETPWVQQAQSEAQQRQRIGLLFDLQRLAEEEAFALNQLAERQESSGGFSWFPGGRENWYMTQYIVQGLGQLDALGVAAFDNNPTADRIATNALRYIDGEAARYYEEHLARIEAGDLDKEEDHLSLLMIHYLYARSFFPGRPFAEPRSAEAHAYFLDQGEAHWNEKGLYAQGLLSLALHRAGRSEGAQRIVRSLRERAIVDEELGMYWAYDRGYFWHQMPIETHALMIESFYEVAGDEAAVEELKLWLLKNKQTSHWKTTKATAAAVFALLRYGQDWLAAEETVAIDFPDMRNREVDAKIEDARATAEPGTGYYKTTWTGSEVVPEMARVRLKNPNDSPAWGALYWQYFEDLDKIEGFLETPLQITRSLYRERYTDRGPVLEPFTEAQPLNPGDKVVVRIELRVDRDMEYVHLKDMRAAGFEPVNVLSRYQFQGGLGYYESTGDVATHFFFTYLPKGAYVFEYPVRVTHRGDFSNGISNIQCMYAPEFTSHSQGIRVTVE